MGVTDFLWAIPVFGLLIFIHELGHFSVAKFFGIRVHEFALGFGPTLVGFDKGDTRYNLRLVPLGGFVRMAGMEDGDVDDPQGFNRKPAYARALVIAAGPIMNFVLAALLYASLLFFVGVDVSESTRLGEIMKTCDTVVAGQTVSRPCPAYTAGLQKGDEVQSINGVAVRTWQELQQVVTESGGKTLAFRVLRGQQTIELRAEAVFEDGRWIVGIRPSAKKAPLGTSLVQGVKWTYQTSIEWVKGLGLMITGRLAPELSGPVGITRTIAETASQGIDVLVLLAAFLSINLGLFNLLPIPALDGSRLIFLGVESVRGRKLDPTRENIIHFVGFVILIGLMLVITYKEVAKLIG
ncbi:MAG: putative rane-associated Zn-dependent protease [Symbiobacteriaceae bacterium]|nr:putative rane-associated Zn-dependent protease [Symbiobacteriaceae bacterium]